jgi:MerR family transcriptional regulator/heat shock protein HspR
MERIGPETPVYVISVAAKLVGVHAQTLRLYEREGLVEPSRSGNRRLYSENDIRRLRYICYLTRQRGVNLSGVRIILELYDNGDSSAINFPLVKFEGEED